MVTYATKSYNKEFAGEKLRRFIHPLVCKILSIQRKFRLEVSGEISNEQPLLFVANHYGIDELTAIAGSLPVSPLGLYISAASVMPKRLTNVTLAPPHKRRGVRYAVC